MNDREIHRMYDIAYDHAVEVFGHFPKPKLTLEDRKHLNTGFYYVASENTIYMFRKTKDNVYRSFLHELTHAYIEYCDNNHKAFFTDLCKKVGGCVCR